MYHSSQVINGLILRRHVREVKMLQELIVDPATLARRVILRSASVIRTSKTMMHVKMNARQMTIKT